MDYVPPPDLQAQYAFVKETKEHFFWRGLKGEYAPTFSRRDLAHIDKQAEPRGEECMRQLKETGRCVFNNLTARNGDRVVIQLDRGCATASREGAITGSATFAIPEKIGKLLPQPEKPLPALDCSRQGVVHQQVVPVSLRYNWQDLAGLKASVMPPDVVGTVHFNGRRLIQGQPRGLA